MKIRFSSICTQIFNILLFHKIKGALQFSIWVRSEIFTFDNHIVFSITHVVEKIESQFSAWVVFWILRALVFNQAAWSFTCCLLVQLQSQYQSLRRKYFITILFSAWKRKSISHNLFCVYKYIFKIDFIRKYQRLE